MYTSVGTLGTGGMSRVDLAVRRHGRFARLYAVKRLRPGLGDDRDFREMLFDEARIAGLLRHPNVASAIDFGVDAEGPYLVMDYVEGISAAQLAVERRGEIPIAAAVEIVMQAARGLHAAHSLVGSDGRPLELVHRDVTPTNILLGFDGLVRVADFGIAKAMGRVTRTETGLLKGKLGYMSPEQLRFEQPDRRSDLFSLGVVLFELASGERLYKPSDGHEAAYRILNEPPPDLSEACPDAPPELVELAFELLSKERAHRPATAEIVAERLEEILRGDEACEGWRGLSSYLCEGFADTRLRLSGNARRALDTVPVRRSPARSAVLGAVLAVTAASAAGIAYVVSEAPSSAQSGRKSVPARAAVVEAPRAPELAPIAEPVSAEPVVARPPRRRARPPVREEPSGGARSSVPVWTTLGEVGRHR